MNKLTNEILAYAAGLLDGEGCIRIETGKGGKRAVSISYWLRVSITNADEPIVIWLKQYFGGQIHIHQQKNPKWKVSYIWRITAVEASNFLKLLLPYIQIKKNQAEIAISFQEEKTYYYKHRDQNIIIPQDIIDKRELVRQQLVQMKQEVGRFFI